MQRWLPLAFGSLAACGTDGYVVPEADGVAIARQAFEARGVTVSETRAMGPLTIDAVGVSFVLDGWNATRGLGFEYVAEADPDFVEAATDLGDVAESEKLQTAVDAALATEPDSHVLVLHTWTHETAELAEDQLRRHVDGWLTEQGL